MQMWPPCSTVCYFGLCFSRIIVTYLCSPDRVRRSIRKRGGMEAPYRIAAPLSTPLIPLANPGDCFNDASHSRRLSSCESRRVSDEAVCQTSLFSSLACFAIHSTIHVPCHPFTCMKNAFLYLLFTCRIAGAVINSAAVSGRALAALLGVLRARNPKVMCYVTCASHVRMLHHRYI